MKTFLFLFLSFIALSSNAQFAIISDKDGFVNVRQEGATSAKVIDTLKNDHLIYCFGDSGNWTNISYSKKKKQTESDGYVYRDRYKYISAYLKIPLVKQTANTVTLSKDSIAVTVSEEPFEKTKHVLKYAKENSTLIELVDGKEFYGTDGEMPQRQYKKIVVKVGQATITLQKEAIKNLFQPSLDFTQVNFDKERNIIYIQSSNSDGAGSYEIIWKIENGVYKERLVTYGF